MRSSRAIVSRALRGLRAHSQMRRIRQPARRSPRLTFLSRALFAINFGAQKSSFVFGTRACFGQPCQKQPSTNRAIRSRHQTKSGRPSSLAPRRQPVMRRSRINSMSRSSVCRFPLDRTRDMRSERSAGVRVSDTDHPLGGFCSKCAAMSALICSMPLLFGVLASEVAQGRPGCSVSQGERSFARVSARSPCLPKP